MSTKSAKKPSQQSLIAVHLDDTVKTVKLFQKPLVININTGELFKYAVLMMESPKHVKESAFEFLQSLIPSMEGLYSHYLSFTADSIINLSDDDRIKKIISEIVGVGLGLKYSSNLLKVNPNKFVKIGKPTKGGKYLDYSVVVSGKLYHIETKGTVSESYASMKKDIIAKKANPNPDVHLKFGTIAMMLSDGKIGESKFVVVDDPPEEKLPIEASDYQNQLYNYASYLSVILDSKYYNKFIKPLLRGRPASAKITDSRFFGEYIFNNKHYYGECFDYRLIQSNVEMIARQNFQQPSQALEFLTARAGKMKFFVGIEKRIIAAINKSDEPFLSDYQSEEVFLESEGGYKCLSRDGIFIVKSADGLDRQLENIFTEKEVERRLGLYANYLRGEAHLCGEPCRSRGIEGKPCAKHTFRSACYYHR